MQSNDSFLALSAALTGFSTLDLLGTGMEQEYQRTLDATLPPGIYRELLETWASAGGDEAATDQIIADPKLGPVARNLIQLWYCGTWSAMPDDWRSTYGTTPLDTSRVVSPEAFQAGLQWVVAGAHAPASGQQGFAAWAIPPEGSSR